MMKRVVKDLEIKERWYFERREGVFSYIITNIFIIWVYMYSSVQSADVGLGSDIF